MRKYWTVNLLLYITCVCVCVCVCARARTHTHTHTHTHFLFTIGTWTIASSLLHAFTLDNSRHVSEHFYVCRVSSVHHWRVRSHKWRLPLYTVQFNNSVYLDKARSGISSCKKLSLWCKEHGSKHIIPSFVM